MSAETAVAARLFALLSDDGALARLVHGVFDRPTPRASAPYVALGAVSGDDWGTKDRPGRELRLEIRHVARDAEGAGPVAERIGAAVAALRGAAADWDIVSARLLRSRSEHGGRGQWEQAFEIRARCLARAAADGPATGAA